MFERMVVMMDRFRVARQAIDAHIDQIGSDIFTRDGIESILGQNRKNWSLPQTATVGEFIDFLVSDSHLTVLPFKFPSLTTNRYVWRKAPILEVIATLRPRSFFCHYTAVKAHGLTMSVPKMIYVNAEQPGRSNAGGRLRQPAVNVAFFRPQRLSKNIATVGDYQVCMLSGQNTNNLGVETFEVPDIYSDDLATVRMTNIERTLIDIAVRSSYSGGVFEVLDAYTEAAPLVSVKRMVDYLNQMRFVYPYHQAIGYLMEKSGAYKSRDIDLLRGFSRSIDFFLTHNIRDGDFIADWRLTVPKGF
jgi:predicted transcriptional regulator of viral defense system